MVAFAPYVALRTGEPKTTIFNHGLWDQARRALALAPGEIREHLCPLFALAEEGWERVRRLQAAYEAAAGTPVSPGATGKVLAFMDADVVDAYRGFAVECVGLVGPHPDLEAVKEEACRFDRNLVLLKLAALAAPVPPGLRERICLVADSMGEWYPDVAARIARAEQTIGVLLACG